MLQILYVVGLQLSSSAQSDRLTNYWIVDRRLTNCDCSGERTGHSLCLAIMQRVLIMTTAKGDFKRTCTISNIAGQQQNQQSCCTAFFLSLDCQRLLFSGRI